MKKFAGLLVLLATSSAYAGGGGSGNSGSNWLCQIELFFGLVSSCPSTGNGNGGSGPTAAPEIDSASAIAGLTLAIGGLAVLRGRRIQKTKV
jgi:hypothetical protein